MSRLPAPRRSALRVPVLAAALLAILSAVLAAAPREVERIRIRGSDTMLHLTQRWAEEFMRDHAARVVEVEGGGTGRGLEALIEGRVEIAAASRPIEAEEARRMVDAHGTLGYAVLVARDALSVYLHPENPVRVLTLDETRRIFAGEITRWDAVGGPRAPIRVLNRNPASGTRLFFAQHVLLEGEYTRRAEVLPTTEAIVERVRRDPEAVGYGGIGYAEGVRTAAVDGVLPTPESVREGRYPIARYLYLYTAVPPRGPVKELVDWVLGPRGQQVVEEVGYLPLHSGAALPR